VPGWGDEPQQVDFACGAQQVLGRTLAQQAGGAVFPSGGDDVAGMTGLLDC